MSNEKIKSTIQFLLKCLPIFGLSALVGLVIYAIHLGIFHTTESLQNYIEQFGDGGIALFIFIQFVQVLVPILPGGISTVVGMLLFGPVYGLIYSYIGLILGEVAAFFMVRHYGRGVVKLLLSEKNFKKFDKMMTEGHKNVKKLLILTFLVPFGPDDIACLVAGMSGMKFKDFFVLILLLKPWSVGIYGYLMFFVLHNFIQ
ncbi:MAG: TVP38/TMEM64 family protein [Lactobacillales bacterium]|nr:TVP38/TMEM64 family protein [Lactobacillales bacterium]